MTIEYAVLGFLSWRSLSGYDLKKLFSDSSAIYWSGNSNQIYRALVKLYEQGWVSKEIEYQEERPNRKIYTITEAGQEALRGWLKNAPELPQYRHSFLVQLTWADLLAPDELNALLSQYEAELQMQVQMVTEKGRRAAGPQPRTPREAVLWQMILENEIEFYQHEINWTKRLRQALNNA